jgi:hypothetical protein
MSASHGATAGQTGAALTAATTAFAQIDPERFRGSYTKIGCTMIFITYRSSIHWRNAPRTEDRGQRSQAAGAPLAVICYWLLGGRS